MDRDRIEHWHDVTDLLLADMGLSPTDKFERAKWANVLAAIGELRIALRQMHGEWIDVLKRKTDEMESNERAQDPSQ